MTANRSSPPLLACMARHSHIISTSRKPCLSLLTRGFRGVLVIRQHDFPIFTRWVSPTLITCATCKSLYQRFTPSGSPRSLLSIILSLQPGACVERGFVYLFLNLHFHLSVYDIYCSEMKMQTGRGREACSLRRPTLPPLSL